jgi:hypothetical protein
MMPTPHTNLWNTGTKGRRDRKIKEKREEMDKITL